MEVYIGILADITMSASILIITENKFFKIGLKISDHFAAKIRISIITKISKILPVIFVQEKWSHVV